MNHLILVLDDDVASSERDEFRESRLPAGRNRSETMAEALLKTGFDVLLYDGRDAEGSKEFVDDANLAAAELVSRIASRYSSKTERTECDVLLDLQWFEDPDYGRRLLSSLFERPEIAINRIVVWSVVTDRGVRRQFFDQFEVSPDYVIDRGKTKRQTVLDCFISDRSLPSVRLTTIRESSDIVVSGEEIAVGPMTDAPYNIRDTLRQGRTVLISGDGISDSYIGLGSQFEIANEYWEVVSVAHPADGEGFLEIRCVS